MKHGELLAIYVSPNKGEPMESVTEITALKGEGLAGDRYQTGKGAWSNSKRVVIRQVSLIASEAIAQANQEYNADFTPADTRRNLLTKDIDLNELVGVIFTISGIAMLGIELCDPCERPSKLSGKKGFEQAFQNRGGLRAEILEDGDMTVGDQIVSQ